jgi:hypothetical protein
MLNMAEQNREKLNQLQQLLPEGLLATAAWLKRKGYASNLLAYYASRGWLESPARGVYRRPGVTLKWQHVVASLQNILEYAVHVGGQTALEIQGRGHFVRLSGVQTVHLYAPARLPSWLHRLPLKEKFVNHLDRLFEQGGRGLTSARVNVAEGSARSDDPLRGVSLTEIPWGGYDWVLTYSTLERAYLELLDEITSAESVAHANLILQGLTTLSPRRLKTLLGACRSVKVKRLFFALAERHNHQWVRELKPQDFDLGKGKRQLAPGGKLHPKYQITLPSDLDDSR